MLLYVIIEKEKVECFVEKGDSKTLANRLFERAKDDAVTYFRSLKPVSCDDWSELKDISGGALCIFNDIVRREIYFFGEDFLANDTVAQTFYILLLHKLWTNRFMLWANEGLFEFANILQEFGKCPKLPRGYEFSREKPHADWQEKQAENIAILKNELQGNTKAQDNLDKVYSELLKEQENERTLERREQFISLVNFLFLQLPMTSFSMLVCSIFVVFMPLLLSAAIWSWCFPSATSIWFLQQMVIVHALCCTTLCPFLLKIMGMSSLFALLKDRFYFYFVPAFGFGAVCSIKSAIFSYLVILPYLILLVIFGHGRFLLSSFLFFWSMGQLVFLKQFWNDSKTFMTTMRISLANT